MTPPLSPQDLYHTGIVVPDVDAAAARLSTATGYRWTQVIEHTVAVSTAEGELNVPMRLAYSVQAPHLELVQEVPGTLWSAKSGWATHHLGYWVDDVALASTRLALAGYPLEARTSGDGPAAFAYHLAPDGLRIEIVNRNLFGDWPGFLASMAADTEN